VCGGYWLLALCDREGGGLGASERAKGDCLAVEYKTSGPDRGIEGGFEVVLLLLLYDRSRVLCQARMSAGGVLVWDGVACSFRPSLSLSPDQGTVRHGDCIDLKITGYRNTYLDT
jgi:hypothetical protein